MGFVDWLTERELVTEGYVVYDGRDRPTRLVAVPETRTKMVVIGLSDGEGHLGIYLRPLAGEVVSGVGFHPQYLVCDHGRVESEIERRILSALESRYKKQSMPFACEDCFSGLIKQHMGGEIPSGVKVHANNVLFVIRSDSIDYTIGGVVDFLVKQAQPLIANGLLDYFEAHGGPFKIMFQSDRHRAEVEKYKDDETAGIGFLKHIADVYLKAYPLCHAAVMSRLDRLYPGYKPSTAKVPVSSSAIKAAVDDIPGVAGYALAATLKADDRKLGVAEAFLKGSGDRWAHEDGILDFLDHDRFEEFRLHLPDNLVLLPRWFFDADVVRGFKSTGVYPRYTVVKKALEDAVAKYAADGEDPGLPWDMILDHLDDLDLDDRILGELKSLREKRDAARKEAEEKRKQEIIKNTFLLDPNTSHYKYLVAGQDRWKDVDQGHLRYFSNGEYEIQVGRLALDEGIVDSEDVFYDAIERAEEEQYPDLPARPSEGYGEDDDQVNDDIDEHWEEFLDDNPEIEEAHEDVDSWEDLIRRDYRDRFVRWRIEKLRELEEGEESWKYEPDTESHDFQVRAAELEEELAERVAWEKGLVTLVDGHKEMDVTLESRHWAAFSPVFRKTLEINRRERDEEFNEPYITLHKYVTVYFVDRDRRRQTVSKWLEELKQV